MPGVSEARLGLAEYLTGLRAELSEGLAEPQPDNFPYEFGPYVFGDVKVELDIAFERASQGGGKPAFWVIGRAQDDGDCPAPVGTQRLTVQLVRRSPTSAAADRASDESGAELPPPVRSRALDGGPRADEHA